MVSVIILIIVMLSVVKLGVMAPYKQPSDTQHSNKTATLRITTLNGVSCYAECRSC
jgi:hypothetical protein